MTREYAVSVDPARARFVLWDYDHTRFAAGARVLDIGCGDGEQLRALAARGCTAVGIDVALAPGSHALHGVARARSTCPSATAPSTAPS